MLGELSFHSVLGPAAAWSSADGGDINVLMTWQAFFGTSSLFSFGRRLINARSCFLHFLGGLTYFSPLINS